MIKYVLFLWFTSKPPYPPEASQIVAPEFVNQDDCRSALNVLRVVMSAIEGACVPVVVNFDSVRPSADEIAELQRESEEAAVRAKGRP